MKKITFLLLLLLFLLPSCSQPEDITITEIITKDYIIYNFQWKANGTSGQSNHHYAYDLSIPEITQGVIDSGAVVCYLKGTSSALQALPAIFTYSSYTSFYNYVVHPGGVEFYRMDSDLTTNQPPNMTFVIKIFRTKDIFLRYAQEYPEFVPYHNMEATE